MSVADEIKARIDIVSYIQQYVPLKRAGKSYKACCPFHNEKSPSFSVSVDKQSWHCWGACATGGDVIAFAQRHHGWSFSEALQELGKLAGVEVEKQSPEQRQNSERLDVLRGLMHTAADAYHNALLDPKVERQAEVLGYTRDKRGFTDATITQFKIGYAPPGWTHMMDHLKTLGYSDEQMIEAGLAIKNEETGRVYDRFRNRLMIPIRDERGRIIGFGARALADEDNPKYLNSPQTPLFDKSRTLFGLDVAKTSIRESETAVIVEGYMDVIQAHQAGFKNVVAQMGTAMTETQLRLLTRSAKRIVLALDADAAGQSATRRSLETARHTLQSDFGGRLSVDIRVLQIPGAKDPDDLIRETPEQWAELVTQAMPVAEYVIEMETAALPANATVQEREAVARSLLPILMASEDKLYSADNLHKLARRLLLQEQDLRKWGELLLWEQVERKKQQVRIEGAKKPRPASPQATPPPNPLTVYREGESIPPEPPPLDDEAFVPDDGYIGEETPPSSPLPEYREGEQYAPGMPVQPMRRIGTVREAAMEVQCLRVLFREPMAYYMVNRKLRELANDNRRLIEGPLAEWCADDFSHAETRALMQAFVAALVQDELDPLDYLRLQADIALQPQLDVILADDLSTMRERVRDAGPADLQRIYANNRSMIDSTNGPVEVVEKALELRARRLKREREELAFLQMDAQTSGDEDAMLRYGNMIFLSNQAQQLLDNNLQKFKNSLRE